MTRALALALLLSGCSSILGLEDGIELTADAGVEPPDLFDAPVVVVELYVDPNGDDAADGSIFTPFRTITHAVSQAQPGWIVHLAPGSYRDGESFPIVVDVPGLEIAGPTDGSATIVGDPGVFELGTGFLHDVQLSSSCGDGVVLTSGARVERCTISAPIGVGIRSSSFEVIVESNQVNGSATGVAINDNESTGAVGSIGDNIIRDNVIGLSIQTSGNGGALSFGNEISCNTNVDINASGGGEIIVPGTRWDHDPPSEGLFDPGNDNGGVDIATDGATTVTPQDLSLSDNPCP